MKKPKGILRILIPILLSMCTGCKITTFTEPLEFSLDLLDIDALIVPENSRVDQEFTLTVKGRLPDPSWTFDHFELTVQDLSMTVKPVGKQDLEYRSTFAESSIPFERDMAYTAADPGTLRITVVGRNKTIHTEIDILDDS